ncbi:MAG TPA: ABC transporter ATP-binding protein, partial [Chloroflexota bacterium]
LPRLVWASVKLLWSSSPRVFTVVALLQVLGGAAAGLQLILVRNLLEATLGSNSDFSAVVVWLLALAGVLLFTTVSGSTQWEWQRLLSEYVNRRAILRILDVAAAANLETFETPDFHNRLERAWMTSGGRPIQTTQSLLGLVGSVSGVVGIALGLFTVLPILVPLLFVGCIPILMLMLRSSRARYEFDFMMTPVERRRSYISRVLTHRQHAHEVIAFGLADYLGRRWRELHDERLRELRRLVRIRLQLASLAALAETVLFIAPVALVTYLLVTGTLAVPQAVAAATGILLLRPALRGVLWSSNEMYECGLFLDDYEQFVNLKNELDTRRGTAPAPLSFATLQLDGVTFTYPTGDRPALLDVSLEVRAGEIIALVGENGSGKTTLAKLLCGLYTPSAGTMTWDGLDTSAMDPSALRRGVAVLFQDFCQYFLSVRENIGVGRHERLLEPDSIPLAAQQAGADRFITDLPDGYETLLGPEFEGGHNLSVGQWQRMALARAFLRDAPLVILDEPTAALDARAEHELFDSMRSLFQGRTVLLISHRFSSVRSADRIYVLHHGRLIEHGTHGELMALSGQYAELFTLQAEAYQAER